MTHKEMMETIETLYQDLVRYRLEEKSNQYAPDGGDRLKHFRMGASVMGHKHPEVAAFNYMAKHLGVLRDLCYGDFHFSRDLEWDMFREVGGDMINYIFFILVLAWERLRYEEEIKEHGKAECEYTERKAEKPEKPAFRRK